MKSEILNKILNKGRRGNPLDRLGALEQKSNAGFLRDPSAEKLTDITGSLGTIVEGEFIAPASTATSVEPTDTGFTGAAMGGNGWTFGGTVYHFVAVAAGILQAGFNAAGKFLAGSGAVILDELGVTLVAGVSESEGATIKWKNSSGTLYGSITVAEPDANDRKMYIRLFSSVDEGWASGFQINDDGTMSAVGSLSVEGVLTAQTFLTVPSAGALTIAAGAITITGSHHTVDTEGGAASDDLDTINGGSIGSILILRSTANVRDIVVKHGTGNVRLNGGVDYTLGTLYDTIVLLKAFSTQWVQLPGKL